MSYVLGQVRDYLTSLEFRDDYLARKEGEIQSRLRESVEPYRTRSDRHVLIEKQREIEDLLARSYPYFYERLRICTEQTTSET